MKVLSWNTLEAGYDGAWNADYGCPLEIHRRNALVASREINGTTAESLLTEERYDRIRNALHHDLEKEHLDLALFQELTVGDPWTTEMKLPSGYEWAQCPISNDDNIPTTFQDVAYRKSSLQRKDAYFLSSDQDGLPGCLVSFTMKGHSDVQLWVANIHADSSTIRSPTERPTALKQFQNSISSFIDTTAGEDDTKQEEDGNVGTMNNSTKHLILVCGDWNAHLTQIAPDMPGFTPVMLPNRTLDSFSTNNEIGFIAQYDGCLYSDSFNQIYPFEASATRNTTGFMPKGIDAQLTGLFAKEGNVVYYNQSVIPGSQPSDGLSDHMRIITTIGSDRLVGPETVSTSEPILQDQFLLFIILSSAALALLVCTVIVRKVLTMLHERHQKHLYANIQVTLTADDIEFL